MNVVSTDEVTRALATLAHHREAAAEAVHAPDAAWSASSWREGLAAGYESALRDLGVKVPRR